MSNTVKDLRFEATKLRNEAGVILDEIGTEKDATRAEEMNAKAKTLVERATSYDERADMREQIDTDNKAAEARALSDRGEEKGFNGSPLSSDEMNRKVDAKAISQRNDLLERHYAGEILGEEEAKRAHETFPAERLFFRSFIEAARPGAAFTPEERQIWGDYQVEAQRAITPTMQAGSAAAGGSLVPETLVRRIFTKLKFYGPMADIGLVTQFTTDTTGDYKLPTVTNSTDKKAKIVAEGADATRDTLQTGSITLNPRKYTFQLPVTYELLMGGNVDFEAWLMGEVAEFFGRALNEDFTVGDGSNKPTGLVPSATTAGTNAIAANATNEPTEKNIFDLFALLDRSYLDLPDTRFMCHNTLLFKLMSLRAGGGSGNRVFDLSADRRLPILPGGVPIVVNNDIKVGTAAGDVIAALGPLSRYITLRAGGMRANSDYVQISDQYTLAWFEQRDGRPLFPAAADKTFVFLTHK